MTSARLYPNVYFFAIGLSAKKMATKLMARLKKSDSICAASARIAKLFEAIPPAIYQMKKIFFIYVYLVLILRFFDNICICQNTPQNIIAYL